MIDAEELRRKVRQEISPYKAPSLVLLMPYADIPRTGAGKPRKEELRASVIAAREGGAPSA